MSHREGRMIAGWTSLATGGVPILPALAMIPLCLLGCRGDCAQTSSQEGGASAKSSVVVASTTSTDDTGLFGELVPAFEEAHPSFDVSVVAVGTGQALALGRWGDADVLLVHAEREEERFLAEGHGQERHRVMYNDFVLVGPPSDPAEVAKHGDVLDVMKAIATGEGRFVSRGDGSGTHIKEQEILEAASLEPDAEWRLSVGQGMGETLMMASEMQEYTLSDRGTFLALRRRLELEILFEGGERLLNPYGALLVSDPKNPEAARAFYEWLVSSEAKEIIRGFGVEEYGEPLFFPIEE